MTRKWLLWIVAVLIGSAFALPPVISAQEKKEEKKVEKKADAKAEKKGEKKEEKK